jgi:hypothetical protein
MMKKNEDAWKGMDIPQWVPGVARTTRVLMAPPVALPGTLNCLGFSGGAPEGLGRGHPLNSCAPGEGGLNGGGGSLPETERRSVGDCARPLGGREELKKKGVRGDGVAGEV